jgi:DnaJ homolog subfamily A member 5
MLDELDLKDKDPSVKQAEKESNLEEQSQEKREKQIVEESDEELDMDGLYCVACDKAFKSAKSFANHENSKKHRDNVELLKKHMKEEDASLFSTDIGNRDGQDVKSEEENYTTSSNANKNRL